MQDKSNVENPQTSGGIPTYTYLIPIVSLFALITISVMTFKLKKVTNNESMGPYKGENFIIALTLCVTLINENHTYLAKADDETQSSADSYIERKIKNGKTDTTIHNDKDIKKQAVQFYVRRQNDKEPSAHERLC